MKKRYQGLQIISVLLIVGAIALFFYPIIANLIANQARSTALSHYDQHYKKMDKKQIQQQFEWAEQYNHYLFDKQEGLSVDEHQPYKKIMNIGGVMATLDVPAIHIKRMPIFHGSDPLTLDEGLGHMNITSIPIGGKNTRSVITGHSGVRNQVLFSNVNRMKKGDIFYLHILNRKLAYEVNDIRRVYPSAVDSIKIKPGKDLVTLLTCDPPGINTYRLLVTGKHIPLKQAESKKVQPRDWWDYQHLVIYGTCLLLLLLMIYWLVKRRKNKREV